MDGGKTLTDWKHEFSREQYELLIDSILRASIIATEIEESADDLDPPALREMIAALRERVLEALVIGGFDEDDVAEINRSVMASMYTRPDA